jgi:hypothetical protein
MRVNAASMMATASKKLARIREAELRKTRNAKSTPLQDSVRQVVADAIRQVMQETGVCYFDAVRALADEIHHEGQNS